MPKTAVYEDHLFLAGEHEVRVSRKLPSMQAEPIAKPMDQASNCQLWPSVLALHPGSFFHFARWDLECLALKPRGRDVALSLAYTLGHGEPVAHAHLRYIRYGSGRAQGPLGAAPTGGKRSRHAAWNPVETSPLGLCPGGEKAPTPRRVKRQPGHRPAL